MAEDDTQRYHCSYCGCDITLRLKCAECTDFDLCLHCFAAGAVAGSHKRDHSYQLIDEGSFPLLVDDWGAIEEVLLLDAVEQDGFGNWEDIAAHVVTKTARESRDHYSDVYISGIIGEGTIPSNYHATVLDNHGGEEPPTSSEINPVKLEHTEQLELGYMPLRDDFEREFDNDAETLISGVMVDSTDDDLEKQLKVAHVDSYTMRVMERERRKMVAKQHNLIAGKSRQSVMKRKHNKDERELRGKFKQLSRLMEPEEYEEFITSLKKENQLKQKIKELMRYRKNGITRLDECPEFDTLRQEQEKMMRGKDSSDGSPGDESDQDVVLAPGLSLLSSGERKICHTVSMAPQKYLQLKAEILKTTALKRSGYTAKPKLPKTLTSEQRTKLLHFFQQSGWLV